MENKIKVKTYVQGKDESGDEFGQSITKILDAISELGVDTDKAQFHFTTADNGRQTCNIVYKKTTN